MKLTRIALTLLATFAFTTAAHAQSYKATLSGWTEVPAVSSSGSGEVRLKVLSDTMLEYTLSYENLDGTTTTGAHVHLGQKSVNGGVIFFLCGGGGRPACTPTSGYFTGTVTAADILGPTGQGIAAGEFAEVLSAIRAGVTYANVHTDKHPGGEIRGKVE